MLDEFFDTTEQHAHASAKVDWTVFTKLNNNITFQQARKTLTTAGFIRLLGSAAPLGKNREQTRHPSGNLTLTTGEDFWVLDVDSLEQGKRLSNKLCVDNDDALGSNLVVSTGRGAHFYYAVPENLRIPSSIGFTPGFDKIDVRAAKSCVVVPPSVHANGKKYRVVHSYDLHNGLKLAPQGLLDLALAADEQVDYKGK